LDGCLDLQARVVSSPRLGADFEQTIAQFQSLYKMPVKAPSSDLFFGFLV